MTDLDLFNEARLFLPQYLSEASQRELRRELRAFPNNKTIYSSRNTDPDVLQGDGWRGFVVIDFHSVERKTVSAIVLSNSCDIARANRRALVTAVTFAPLIRLGLFVDKLRAAGQTEEQIASLTQTIRRQEVTSLMYLPGRDGLFEDSVALFGDAHSQPVDAFYEGGASALFRLSDFGFYLFLFKLSIHFNRMLEGVER